jgi:hypothetical protein
MYQNIFNNLEIDAQKMKENETNIKELIKERNQKEREINTNFSYKYRALENIYRKTYDDIHSEHQKELKENFDLYNEKIKQLKTN